MSGVTAVEGRPSHESRRSRCGETPRSGAGRPPALAASTRTAPRRRRRPLGSGRGASRGARALSALVRPFASGANAHDSAGVHADARAQKAHAHRVTRPRPNVSRAGAAARPAWRTAAGAFEARPTAGCERPAARQQPLRGIIGTCAFARVPTGPERPRARRRARGGRRRHRTRPDPGAADQRLADAVDDHRPRRPAADGDDARRRPRDGDGRGAGACLRRGAARGSADARPGAHGPGQDHRGLPHHRPRLDRRPRRDAVDAAGARRARLEPADGLRRSRPVAGLPAAPRRPSCHPFDRARRCACAAGPGQARDTAADRASPFRRDAGDAAHGGGRARSAGGALRRDRARSRTGRGRRPGPRAGAARAAQHHRRRHRRRPTLRHVPRRRRAGRADTAHHDRAPRRRDAGHRPAGAGDAGRTNAARRTTGGAGHAGARDQAGPRAGGPVDPHRRHRSRARRRRRRRGRPGARRPRPRRHFREARHADDRPPAEERARSAARRARAADAGGRPHRLSGRAGRLRQQQQGRPVHQPAPERLGEPEAIRRRGFLPQPRRLQPRGPARRADGRRGAADRERRRPHHRDDALGDGAAAAPRAVGGGRRAGRAGAAGAGEDEPAGDSAGAVPRARGRQHAGGAGRARLRLEPRRREAARRARLPAAPRRRAGGRGRPLSRPARGAPAGGRARAQRPRTAPAAAPASPPPAPRTP